MRFLVYEGKSKAVRLFSFLLSVCILCALFTLPSAVSSASSQEELTDIKAHWAEAVILKWVNQGLAKGYGDGRFGPNDNITRAEFVTLLNRIFGYQQKSEKSFPDVKAGAWYAAEIAKAYQAGIIGGDNNGNMNPEAVISRQEASVILARAYLLAGDNLDAALKYSDVGQIAEWALGSVGTMTKKGYVTGRPGNLFAPKANLSRCEAVKMIDNVMGELINTSGTYTRVVPGNMVISSPGVTLKDTYIEGDLYLTEGIGTDTIKLVGVAVKGRTIIAGSIEGISLTDTLLEQDVLVLNGEGKVTISAGGLTEVSAMTVYRNAVLSEQDLTGSGFMNIQIAGAANGMEIVLRGDFDDITVEAPQANVMLETGTVANLVFDKASAGTTLTAKNGTVIENMTLYAEANITGGKNIKHAVIASGGVKMDQKPKQVTIAEGGHIAYSNQGSTQDQSTPRPTSNPGSTEKPISTPTSTPKPTNKPKPTAEPTQKPNNTPTPTQGPTASPTPTSTPDPDTTPPSVPTNLTGTAVSSAIIRLSWTASTDNVGLVGYCVYRDEKLIGTSTTTSYSDTGLTAGATYSYTVAAYDGVGNVSNKCGAVSITMPLSSGIVYYIDFENGDDANEGTSPESPWKHCPGDSNAVGVAAAASLSPGDTVLFRGGVIYRGMIKTISDGINYRGDAWPAGVKAIIDGSDPFLNEKKPCTQEECGTNPNWSNIVCVDLPETIEKYSDFLMFDESSKLWLAQFPKVPDPFWEDDFSNYRPVSKENITVNSIKDPEFFNQTDPHYWDGAYIMIWINPNSVITQPVTGYDPATGTIYYKELSENAIYGDRDQYFSMINHIDLITQPGEYYVDEASHKMYFWPRDNSELSLVTRSTGFNVVGNNDLVFEGFIIQRLVGGSAVYTRGAWMGSGLISNNLTIRNNEMRWIRKNGSIHTGAITLRKGSGHIIENNYIHDIQRGSGIHVPGEVSDTIIRNNVITRSGYKGIWLMGDQNIQITGNLFYDNKATHGTDVSVFTSKNVLFANNIAYNSKTEMFSFEHDENIFIYNNILLGNGASAGIIRQNGDDMKGILFIAHNTVLYSGNNIGLNCSPSRYEDARYIVKNNILDGWQAESTRYEVSNNIYTGLSWNQKERYGWYLMPGETVENNLHLIFRSPVEEVAPVVVPTDDVVEIYKLKDGSPAIGAGEILNDVIPQEALQLFPNFEFYQDFRGNPRPGDQKGDIGALQYSGK